MALARFDNDLRYRAADHPNQTQFTPAYILKRVRRDFGTWAGDGVIGLDPCTTAENPTRAEAFFTAEVDGLAQSWGDERWRPSVFANPPYGKAREPWVERCIEAGAQGQKVILLIPAATDTRIFQRAASSATSVVFVKGRVKFGVLRPNRRQFAASHPSALIGWNTSLTACAALGWRCGANNARRVDELLSPAAALELLVAYLETNSERGAPDYAHAALKLAAFIAEGER